jgi:hypothetical protein
MTSLHQINFVSSLQISLFKSRSMRCLDRWTAAVLTPKAQVVSRGVNPLREYLFSVAQSCTLSVSVEIAAGCDDFGERGSVSRSTLLATDVLDLSKRWAAGKAAAGHRPALLWLRLSRAAPYRRFVIL